MEMVDIKSYKGKPICVINTTNIELWSIFKYTLLQSEVSHSVINTNSIDNGWFFITRSGISMVNEYIERQLVVGIQNNKMLLEHLSNSLINTHNILQRSSSKVGLMSMNEDSYSEVYNIHINKNMSRGVFSYAVMEIMEHAKKQSNKLRGDYE